MNIRKSFVGWTLDRKMRFLITIIIVITTTVILIASAISSYVTVDKQSRRMAHEQLDTLATSLDEELNSYNALIIALEMDKSVQDYLNSSTPTTFWASKGNQAYNTVLSAANMYENLNFILIQDKDTEHYVIRGNGTISVMRIFDKSEKDLAESNESGYGTLRITYSGAYLENGDYNLNLYQPIYATKHFVREIGSIVLNVDSPVMEQLSRRSKENDKENIFLTTSKGKVMSQSRRYEIGSTLPKAEQLKSIKGEFDDNGKTYLYQKVGKWNFCLVSELSHFELYQDFLRVLIFLITLIATMTMIALVVMGQFIKMVYKPLNKVLTKMDHVADGRIDVRINADHMGKDFEKLSIGFNSMMDEIQVLMEKVKLEQHQIEQIRFNALQSQIQPHFLYNTLDCIHWQAAVEGNKEISTMVKALAQYYRICLSKGKDIINLEMELEHIRNYLIIQNMRYDNIIETDIQVEKQFYQVSIPKMTLQPLIENSIYHGLKVKEGEKGKITVRAEYRGEDVCIIIEDTGKGMNETEITQMNESISDYNEAFGYGIRNVNKRIEIMYGKDYGLFYKSNPEGGIIVEIKLPNQEEAMVGEVK